MAKKMLICFFVLGLSPSVFAAGQETLTAITKKSTGDFVTQLRTDVNTELAKQQRMNTELYTLKADSSCFSSESAFNSCFSLDWQSVDASGFNGNLSITDDTLQEIAQKVDDLVLGSGSGVDAFGDIVALWASGNCTGYLYSDGTCSTPTGSVPTGTEGQTIQYGSGGTPGAVNLAPLAFTDNVSRNTTTGVVSVPVTATATSGSAVPFTSGGAYTQLAGKQDADPDLNTAAGASGAGNSKYFGTNSGGTAGFYDLPISAGGIPHVSSGDPSTAGAWNYNTTDHKLRTRESNGDVYVASALTLETAADTAPNAFTFTDETDIALSTAKISNAIAVTGINWPAAISVTGDTGYGYSKNGAACTTAPGSVSLNDTVSACVTSSASNGTATTSTVTIGGVSDTYSATTMAGSSCTSGTLTGGIDWITGKTNNSGGALSAGNPKGQSFTLGETVGIYSFSISISSTGGANPITCRYGTNSNLSSYIGVGTTTMATGTREIVFDTHTPIPAGTTIYAACVMDADSPVAYYDRALEDNTTGVAISGSGSWSTVSAETSDMKFQVKVCQ